MTITSINSLTGKASQAGLIVICGILGAVLILFPVPIFYKIGFLAFIAMVFAFFVNTFYAMLLFLFIRPAIEPLINVQIIQGIPLVGFFALFIIIFFIFKFLTDRSYTIAIPHIGWLWLLLPFCIFSMFNSINLIISLAHLLRLIGWISIYILIFNLVKNKDDARMILITLILSSIIPSLVGYYQLFTHTGYVEKLRGITRLTSVFGNQPDTCGVFFSLIFFITLIFFIQSKDLLKRILLSLAMLSILILIIFTYHRTSWVGLIIGAIIISILDKKMLKVIIPVFLLMVIIFHAEIVNRILDHFHPPKYTTSALTTRVTLWHIYIFKLFPQHPFLGWGIGTAGEVIKPYYVQLIPHNDFVRLAVEIGIFGTLLYVIFLVIEMRYYFLKIIANVNREFNAIVLGLLIFFVIASFGQNIFYNVNNMSILFSALAVSKKLNLIQTESKNIS